MLVPVPAGIADDNAALAQPLAVGLHAVNRSGVRPGDVAVVLGAGAIGSFILAGLAEIGCRAVIAADVDPARLTTATALGADRTVDLREESLADVVAERHQWRGRRRGVRGERGARATRSSPRSCCAAAAGCSSSACTRG